MDRVDLCDAHTRAALGTSVEISALFSKPLADASGAPVTTESSSRPVELGALWNGLLDGSLDVVDSFCGESRCFIVLKSAGPEKRVQAKVLARKLRILDAAALGVGQKISAAEHRIAVSTVSFATRQALTFLGFPAGITKMPLIVAILAHAARASSARYGREVHTVRGDEPCRIVSVERPDLSLASRLPPSEYEVMRLFVEGRSHAEIARRRRTARRTIANQLASVFHRLGISGRSELLNTVVVSAEFARDDARAATRS